jgi:hypothetical protein
MVIGDQRCDHGGDDEATQERRAANYAFARAEGSDRGPVPRLFVALTRHVYVLPAVSPVTVIGLPFPALALLAPPFDEVQDAEYFVMAAPLFIGAVKVTCSEPEATFVALAFPGCPGAPAVIPPLIGDHGPVPTKFRAAT